MSRTTRKSLSPEASYEDNNKIVDKVENQHQNKSKEITLSAFLSNSKEIRQYSAYIPPVFEKWYVSARIKDPKLAYHNTYEVWLSIFNEWVNRPV